MSYITKNSIVTLTLLFCSFIFLQGCNFGKTPESLVSPEKIKAAEERIEFLINPDHLILNQFFTGEMQKQISPEVLKQIHDFVPDLPPLSKNLVGYDSYIHHGGDRSALTEIFTFQYQYSNTWLLISLSLQAQNEGELKIAGFNFKTISGDIRELNAFNFYGKPLQNYLVLLITVMVPAFIIYCLYLCYKTPVTKRKWLWYLFIAFGFCSVQLEWATGQLGIQPFAFQLLGSGFARSSMYAPIILSTSVPIGAIIFLSNRRKWLR